MYYDIYNQSDPQLLIYLTSFSTNTVSDFWDAPVHGHTAGHLEESSGLQDKSLKCVSAQNRDQDHYVYTRFTFPI